MQRDLYPQRVVLWGQRVCRWSLRERFVRAQHADLGADPDTDLSTANGDLDSGASNRDGDQLAIGHGFEHPDIHRHQDPGAVHRNAVTDTEPDLGSADAHTVRSSLSISTSCGR